MESSRQDIDFQGSGTYEIRAEGQLSEVWRDRLAGMGLSACESDGGGTGVVLRGELKDQAQLIGILNTLYDLHLPIVGVMLDDD